MRRQEGFSMIDSAKFHEKILCPVWSTKRLPRFGNIANRPSPTLAYPRLCALLTDEIREWAAFEIRQFQEYAYKGGQGSRAPGISLLSTVKPFLEQVWPQERSLATSGVSRHLSCLPAVSGEAFAEVVDVIERFLTPFDCWSMLDYGYW